MIRINVFTLQQRRAFKPSGWTSNPDIGFAKSIMDYIFRRLQLRFLTGQQQFFEEGRYSI